MDETNENMTIKEVANRINRSPTWVGLALQQQRVPFGIAVHNEQTDTWSYHISRAGFENYINGKFLFELRTQSERR